MTNETTVAQTLKDSGLFDWAEGLQIGESEACVNRTFGTKVYSKSVLVHYNDHGRYPTADQAEAILAKMAKLYPTFSWSVNSYGVVDVITMDMARKGESPIEFRGGSLTDRLNAALAWCCTNMRTELERAVEEVL